MRYALALGVVYALVVSCTPDIAATGQGGATGSSSPSSGSQGTTGATSATNGATGSTTSASAASSGDTSAASTSVASASSSDAASSSSSGMTPTDLPFCSTVTDDFNYASEADFIQTAITNGPFASAGDVGWMNGTPTMTFHGGSQIGSIFLTDQAVDGIDCAWTAKLVSVGAGTAAFGFNDLQHEILIRYSTNKIRFVSSQGVDVPLPLYLAIVRVGGVYYAAYRAPLVAQWTYLSPLAGYTVPGSFPSGLPFGIAQIGDAGSTSTWDDFNVVPVPMSALPM